MRSKIYSGLLFAAAALAVAAAIVLPPYLSRLADRRLESAMYSVQAETLDISLDYSMTTAERLALLIQKLDQDSTFSSQTTIDGKTIIEKVVKEQSILTIEDVQPTQDELDAEQAITLCRSELDYLSELVDGYIGYIGSVLFYDPVPFDYDEVLTKSSYSLLYNRNSRQQSLSLWTLSLNYPLDNGKWTDIQLMMDAETGLLYYLYFHDLFDRVYLEPLAIAWGDYLGLGTAAIQDFVSTPDEEWMTATYQTDAGEISYSFQLVIYEDTAYGSYRFSLRVAPFVLQ